MTGQTSQIFIIDRQKILLAGIKTLIAEIDTPYNVSTFTDITQATLQIYKQQPAIVFIDFSSFTPKKSKNLLDVIKYNQIKTTIVSWCSNLNRDILIHCLQNQIKHHCSKETDHQELRQIIAAVEANEPFLGKNDWGNRIFDFLAGQILQNYSTNKIELTSTEISILKLVSVGLTNQQIGDRRACSIETIKTHLKKISHKLSVNSRQQAVEKAIQLGFI